MDGKSRAQLQREANARRAKTREQQRARFAEDPSIAVHGKVSTYTNYACRCDLCKAAGVAAVQDYRIRARAYRALVSARARDNNPLEEPR